MKANFVLFVQCIFFWVMVWCVYEFLKNIYNLFYSSQGASKVDLVVGMITNVIIAILSGLIIAIVQLTL